MVVIWAIQAFQKLQLFWNFPAQQHVEFTENGNGINGNGNGTTSEGNF